jgi:ribokinase
MTRVCVVGSVNMDMGFDVDTLPHPGETVLAASFRSTSGGKGANQAVAAARAGAQVQFVGAVGDDPAATALRAHLTANDVGTDGLITVPGPSGSAVVVVDSTGENLIVVAPGANGRLALDSALLRGLVADCDVLLLQLEIPVSTATDVVVVNETEAAHWVWPVPHRVITRGARGVTYAGDGEEFPVAAPNVEVVDTSGAGDVFAGVLAAGWPTATTTRCVAPVPPARWRHWCPAPATAHPMQRRSTTRLCRTDGIAGPDESRRKGETQCRQTLETPETMAAHARPKVTGWERPT